MKDVWEEEEEKTKYDRGSGWEIGFSGKVDEEAIDGDEDEDGEEEEEEIAINTKKGGDGKRKKEKKMKDSVDTCGLQHYSI